MSVEKTLEERGSRYGKFIDHAEIAQGLQAVIQRAPKWQLLDYDMRQALVVITDKIARILNGDPYYADNWHDIQGYAQLVEKRILDLENKEQELFEESKIKNIEELLPTEALNRLRGTITAPAIVGGSKLTTG